VGREERLKNNRREVLLRSAQQCVLCTLIMKITAKEHVLRNIKFKCRNYFRAQVNYNLALNEQIKDATARLNPNEGSDFGEGDRRSDAEIRDFVLLDQRSIIEDCYEKTRALFFTLCVNSYLTSILTYQDEEMEKLRQEYHNGIRTPVRIKLIGEEDYNSGDNIINKYRTKNRETA